MHGRAVYGSAHLDFDEGGAGLLGVSHIGSSTEVILTEILIVLLLGDAAHIDQVIHGIVVVTCSNSFTIKLLLLFA
jgi:hypothetical protein